MRNKRSEVINELKKGNKEAFKTVFTTYYEKLFFFALKYVYYNCIAEEIVQDVFLTIWEKRMEINIHNSLQSYLFASVKNKSISYLRSKYLKKELNSLPLTTLSIEKESKDNTFEYYELKAEVQKAIKLLPERCRIIFHLSRNSGMTYKQIAKELNISPESVKTQISIALKKIKLHLEKYWGAVVY